MLVGRSDGNLAHTTHNRTSITHRGVSIAPALARTPTPTAGLGKVTTSIMLPYVTPSGRAQTLRRPGITAGSSSSDQGR